MLERFGLGLEEEDAGVLDWFCLEKERVCWGAAWLLCFDDDSWEFCREREPTSLLCLDDEG